MMVFQYYGLSNSSCFPGASECECRSGYALDGTIILDDSTKGFAGPHANDTSDGTRSWNEHEETFKSNQRNASVVRSERNEDKHVRKRLKVVRGLNDASAAPSNETSPGGWYNVTVRVRDRTAYIAIDGRVITQTSSYFHNAGGRAGLLLIPRKKRTTSTANQTSNTYFKAPILTSAAMNYGNVYQSLALPT